MIQLTEEKIWEKYDSLPSKIKEALNSSFVFNLVDQIAKKFFLNETDGEILKAYTGYVILGFIPPQNLLKEITGAEAIDADEKVIVEMIREINRKIFFPLHAELEKLYKLETHIEEGLEKEVVKPVIKIKTEEEKPGTKTKISLEKLGEEKPAGVKIGVSPEKEGEPFDITQGKPLIIHKEEGGPVPVQAEKKFQGLETSFGFFGKGEASAPEEPVKVKVEGLGSRLTKPLFKGEEKRVVHYSELRTPLTPFRKPEEEIISLETFGRKPPETKTPPPAASVKIETPKPAEPPKTAAPEPKPQPKIEGNVVDLSE